MDREPRIILTILGLAALGHVARVALVRTGDPPGQVFSSPGPPGDPVAQRERAIRLARPLAPNETVDLNSASAEEIARLPRIGMSLAKRIAGTRDSLGPFGRLQDLDRVPGVGPALLGALAGRVSFGRVGTSGFSPENPANPSTLGAYGAVPDVPTAALVDLNSASPTDLIALPGIGRTRALAVLAYRRSHGSFAAVSDLERVPGFSRSLVARLAPLITVR